ncbi:hypothetical protein N8I77_011557 [Diaporthe amygdali]|uniref:Uncharacterized protein n=1 Tax=Phomopsis amygdali TaxID=1214568 RepID=A0AAD9S5U8_PHOAM|nr:hypothetical protein N8I77_011557 [Diaporthe amygdali]
MVAYLGNVEPLSSVETASLDGGGNAPCNANFQPKFPQPSDPQNLDPTATAAGMPWTEPSLSQLLSQLLSQPALDVQFLEAAIGNGFSQGPYWSDNG